jgi:hypothetical protein
LFIPNLRDPGTPIYGGQDEGDHGHTNLTKAADRLHVSGRPAGRSGYFGEDDRTTII